MRVALVTPDYFEALGLPMVRGRAFTEQDRDGSAPVVILTEAAVREHFPNENPLGRRITLGWTVDGVPRGGEVVGIVSDFKQSTLDSEADPQIFLRALRKADLEPSAVLFVGDSLHHDVAGAHGVGLRAVHVTGQGPTPLSDGLDAGTPDFEIEQLAELLGIVDGLDDRP